MIKKSDFTLVLVLTLIALFLHTTLAWEYYSLRFGIGKEASFLCIHGQYFDCAAVASSSYSSLWGIPLAVYGFWTHLLFLVFLSLSQIAPQWFPAHTRVWQWVTQNLVFVLVAASLIMGAISLWVIQKGCLYCISSYLITFAQAYFIWKNWKWIRLTASERYNGFKTLGIILLVLPLVSFVAHQVVLNSLGGKRMAYYLQESVAQWRTNPSYIFDLETGIIVRNPSASAPKPQKTLVEFVDLFCPHCKFASLPLKSFVKIQSQAHLIIKLFPLDGACNPMVKHSTTPPLRCQWASFLLCAHAQKKGLETLEYIFSRQQDLAKIPYEQGRQEALQALHLLENEKEMAACETQPQTQETLQKMIQEAQQAQVEGTPTIFLSGKKLPRGQWLPVLEAAWKELD